jgi:hypothetical protein
MLLVGPLAVVAIPSGSRTRLKASAIEADAQIDSSALTRACGMARTQNTITTKVEGTLLSNFVTDKIARSLLVSK